MTGIFLQTEAVRIQRSNSTPSSPGIFKSSRIKWGNGNAVRSAYLPVPDK